MDGTDPDSVSRVRPPKMTMPNTLAALPRSQYATALLLTGGKEELRAPEPNGRRAPLKGFRAALRPMVGDFAQNCTGRRLWFSWRMRQARLNCREARWKGSAPLVGRPGSARSRAAWRRGRLIGGKISRARLSRYQRSIELSELRQGWLLKIEFFQSDENSLKSYAQLQILEHELL